MTREEAIKIIDEYEKCGGSFFFDGVKESGINDKDLFSIAENCRLLMENAEEDK